MAKTVLQIAIDEEDLPIFNSLFEKFEVETSDIVYFLTKEDLQKAYYELEKENFPVTKRIKFIADLGAYKEIAYHYELICKDWKEDKKLNIESSFDRHGSEGIEFLFEQLSKSEDKKIDLETLKYIHSHKTGKLIKLPIEIACIIANVERDKKEVLEELNIVSDYVDHFYSLEFMYDRFINQYPINQIPDESEFLTSLRKIGSYLFSSDILHMSLSVEDQVALKILNNLYQYKMKTKFRIESVNPMLLKYLEE